MPAFKSFVFWRRFNSRNTNRISDCFQKRDIENELTSINCLKGDQSLVSEISSAANLNQSSEGIITMEHSTIIKIVDLLSFTPVTFTVTGTQRDQQNYYQYH